MHAPVTRVSVAGLIGLAGLIGSACSGDDATDRFPIPLPVTTVGASTSTTAPSAATVVAAATDFCEVLWRYVTDVGAAFNSAAADVAVLADADQRRERWAIMLGEAASLLDELEPTVARWADDAVLGPLVEQVGNDVPRAHDELDDIASLFTEQPEIDEKRHQARTQQVIVRLEKVVDLPKPDLAPVDPDGRLRALFREIPSCQHSVRDADDGRPQYNDASEATE